MKEKVNQNKTRYPHKASPRGCAGGSDGGWGWGGWAVAGGLGSTRGGAAPRPGPGAAGWDARLSGAGAAGGWGGTHHPRRTEAALRAAELLRGAAEMGLEEPLLCVACEGAEDLCGLGGWEQRGLES